MKPSIQVCARVALLPLAVAALAGSGVASAASNDIPELSGVWQFGRCIGETGLGRCLLLAEDDARLTERARAYRDAIDEAAQPKYDCAPMSIPHMWSDPYSHQIEQLPDRVVFTYGKDDVVRTAWLPGSEHPEPQINEFLYFGHSHGHYEDGKLIVETSKFTFDPQGLNADFKLASSTQKQVTEVYQIVDGKLDLVVTTIDTFFLKEPWVFHVQSERDEFPLSLPWACDLEASRDILKLSPNAYPNDPPAERIQYP